MEELQAIQELMAHLELHIHLEQQLLEEAMGHQELLVEHQGLQPQLEVQLTLTEDHQEIQALTQVQLSKAQLMEHQVHRVQQLMVHQALLMVLEEVMLHQAQLT